MHGQLAYHHGARLLHLLHGPDRPLALLKERVPLVIPHPKMAHIPLDVQVVLYAERHPVQQAALLALGVPLGGGARGVACQGVGAVRGDPGVVVERARGLAAGGARQDGLGDLQRGDGAGLVGSVEVGGGVVAAGQIGRSRGGDGFIEREDRRGL